MSVPSTGLVFQPPGRLQQYSYEKPIYIRIPLYECKDANYAEMNESVYIIEQVCVDCVRFCLKIRKLDMNKALRLYVKSQSGRLFKHMPTYHVRLFR